jgi:predicted transcriptional regulator of viral defense system/very-short-patch-repair endonuclease
VGDKGQPPRHGELADLAKRQHGVVATRQLDGIGYGRNAVAKAAKAGRLHRVHRGVYVVGYKRLTWHGRCMAAVLASSPSVASHWSAGWLWGLLRSRPGTVHVTCPKGRRAQRSFVTHRTELAAVDQTIRDGIPVTSLPRTILDLAVDSRSKTVARYIERAEESKAFDLGEMRELLDRSNGHQGAAKVSATLDAYFSERQFTRSDLERRFLALVRHAGLPEPAMNSFVAGHEIDAYWDDARFGVEIDVYATHGSRVSFEADRTRDDELLLAGLETIRVTGVRLDREPAAVLDSVRRHLARRAGIK